MVQTFVKIPLDEVEVEDDMRKLFLFSGKYNGSFIKSVVKRVSQIFSLYEQVIFDFKLDLIDIGLK